jgi:dienelactone hydrolase
MRALMMCSLIMRALLLVVAALQFAGAQQLYEEDLLAQMPERIKQWKQVRAYIEALPAAKPPAGRTLQEKIGYPPPRLRDRATARLEKSGEDAVATYYRIYIPITPELETYGLYIIPKGLKARAPLVISLHGGGGFPELATFHGGTNYHDMVRGAVERGYVVFAPHHIFYPYRDRDHETPIPQDVRPILDEQLRARGTTLMSVEVAKITKALDVILERPEVDPARVAMVGLSWGGYYTQYTTALEPRIKVAVASCSFQGELPPTPAKPSYGKPDDIATADLVRLILPRPLQLQYGERDTGLPVDKVRQSLTPLASKLDLAIFPGVHEFNGELAWAFLKKHL